MSPFRLLLSPFSKAICPLSRSIFPFAAFGRVLVVVAVLASGFAHSASAYILEGKNWPAGTVVIVQLGLGSAGRTLQDGNTSWDDAVLPVADVWNQQVQRVQLLNVVNPLQTASSGDRVNSVVFSSSVYGQSFGASTLAVTYYTSSGSNMVEADVLVNRAITFDSYRGPLQFIPHGSAIPDIRRVLLHELGHALGLGHPDTAGQHVAAVMNSVVSNQEVLADDDIAGGQFLYGAPLLSPPPTPTATPPPSPTPTATPNPSPTAAPPSGSTAHLANISTRIRVGVSDNVLIGGCIIRGNQSKTLVVRALGPSLGAAGVQNALQDPVLELHDGSGTIIASNDDWDTSPQAATISSSGLAPSSRVESAVMVTVAPGNYTAVVSGYGNGEGIGLVEAYELDSNSTRMLNISTRGMVGVGENAMIGGWIVQGAVPKRVIIRAIGPSLGGGSNPIAGALADPILELRDGAGNLMASNDNWGESAQAADIVATTLAPSHPRESAILATLTAGSYTAILRGVNDTTGIALVEVYDLDQ
jgi:hypothetical protein